MLEPGDEVVITIMEHHSNLIPWQQVCPARPAPSSSTSIPPRPVNSPPREVLSKVGPRPRSWPWVRSLTSLGVENPVKNLGKLVHKYGGYLVADGAQSLPHMPVNMADLGADFFAFSAHKAMGPMGIGAVGARWTCSTPCRPCSPAAR